MASTQDDGEKPKSKRLFINHVDQFQGRNLAKVSLVYIFTFVCLNSFKQVTFSFFFNGIFWSCVFAGQLSEKH